MSEINNLQDLVQELKMLNLYADINIDLTTYNSIISNVPVEQLFLPEDFYINEKNGLTNKHNTKSGMYISVDVRMPERQVEEDKDESSYRQIEQFDIPEEDVKEDDGREEVKKDKDIEILNIRELITELKVLNPGVKIEIINGPIQRIAVEGGVGNLNLPNGFYYDDKNGLTNKHNTKSGMYLSVGVNGTGKEQLKADEELDDIGDNANSSIDMWSQTHKKIQEPYDRESSVIQQTAQMMSGASRNNSSIGRQQTAQMMSGASRNNNSIGRQQAVQMMNATVSKNENEGKRKASQMMSVTKIREDLAQSDVTLTEVDKAVNMLYEVGRRAKLFQKEREGTISIEEKEELEEMRKAEQRRIAQQTKKQTRNSGRSR